jgi:hypothetical protein
MEEVVMEAPRRPVHETRPPHTALLSHALPSVDFADAFALAIPEDDWCRDPQEWADAVFRAPPSAVVRALFGLRALAVRVVGIEPGGLHVFDTVTSAEDEVLLGVDQKHLAFRVSVLVEAHRVVLTTVVGLRNRRGRAYFAVVRRLHPFVVRGMLARASRTMAVSA